MRRREPRWLEQLMQEHGVVGRTGRVMQWASSHELVDRKTLGPKESFPHSLGGYKPFGFDTRAEAQGGALDLASPRRNLQDRGTLHGLPLATLKIPPRCQQVSAMNCAGYFASQNYFRTKVAANARAATNMIAVALQPTMRR
jgi:hypothetical protein